MFCITVYYKIKLGKKLSVSLLSWCYFIDFYLEAVTLQRIFYSLYKFHTRRLLVVHSLLPPFTVSTVVKFSINNNPMLT